MDFPNVVELAIVQYQDREMHGIRLTPAELAGLKEYYKKASVHATEHHETCQFLDVCQAVIPGCYAPYRDDLDNFSKFLYDRPCNAKVKYVGCDKCGLPKVRSVLVGESVRG